MRREIGAAGVPAKRFARFAAALRTTLGLAVDVALPQLCAACREPVQGAGLCPGCWSKLSFIAPPYCERLGIPFPFDGGPGLLSLEAIADAVSKVNSRVLTALHNQKAPRRFG